jgi:GxxExxY protein
MYKDEGYQIMGAAFEVYNELGYGMAEEVYQQSLEIELELRGIPFETKRELRLKYKERLIEKRYVPDLFISNAIVVKLKAVTQLVKDHEVQLFNYMRISERPVEYLINYGSENSLDWKRFILTDLKKKTKYKVI